MVLYRPLRDNSRSRDNQGEEGNDGRTIIPILTLEVEPFSTPRPLPHHVGAESVDSNHIETIALDNSRHNNAVDSSAAEYNLNKK